MSRFRRLHSEIVSASLMSFYAYVRWNGQSRSVQRLASMFAVVLIEWSCQDMAHDRLVDE